MTTNMENTNNSLATVAAKIKDVKFGMFTTIDSRPRMSSRPLTSQQVDAEGNMWFIVSDEQPFIAEVQANPVVNVTFSDVGDSLYVSVSGRATVTRDRAKAEELWNPMAKAWFPGGLDDPHLALIKVAIEAAEYWDSDASRMRQFYEMAKAAVTGERPVNVGEHHQVTV